jgi:hypothetical protein
MIRVSYIVINFITALAEAVPAQGARNTFRVIQAAGYPAIFRSLYTESAEKAGFCRRTLQILI